MFSKKILWGLHLCRKNLISLDLRLTLSLPLLYRLILLYSYQNAISQKKKKTMQVPPGTIGAIDKIFGKAELFAQ